MNLPNKFQFRSKGSEHLYDAAYDNERDLYVVTWNGMLSENGVKYHKESFDEYFQSGEWVMEQLATYELEKFDRVVLSSDLSATLLVQSNTDSGVILIDLVEEISIGLSHSTFHELVFTIHEQPHEVVYALDTERKGVLKYESPKAKEYNTLLETRVLCMNALEEKQKELQLIDDQLAELLSK